MKKTKVCHQYISEKQKKRRIAYFIEERDVQQASGAVTPLTGRSVGLANTA
ncbi:MAG TPA: hypothetical protein VFG19_17045 [Geobacteraceae bacterium]|nr:hypothetical protein [Geobacteraceae bacterium]